MTRHGAHSYSYVGITSSHGDGAPRLHRGSSGRALEVPDPRRVETEDLRLDLVGERGAAVPLDELIGDPKLPEGVDLPLRVAPEARVRAPHDVIGAEIAEQRAEHVRALERPIRHRRSERRADLGVEVLALRLEALKRGQLALIWPRGVIRDEVEIREVVAHGVEILGMRVARHELSERDALVAADVLEPELARLLPHRIRELLIIEPPAAFLRGVECIELETRDLILLHEHRHPLERLGKSLVRRQAAAEHDGARRPALLDLRLLFDRDHVFAAVIFAEAERIEDRDARVAALEDQLAEVLDRHVLGAVRQTHRLAEIV